MNKYMKQTKLPSPEKNKSNLVTGKQMPFTCSRTPIPA